jgi:hypothetical protein
LDQLARTKIWRSSYAPPIYKLMWRMGIDVMPPHYQSMTFNAIFSGLWFGPAWGICMWFLSWGPNGESLFMAVSTTVVAMAQYYSYGARKFGLKPKATTGGV